MLGFACKRGKQQNGKNNLNLGCKTEITVQKSSIMIKRLVCCCCIASYMPVWEKSLETDVLVEFSDFVC
jgi:hypothetical protein